MGRCPPLIRIGPGGGGGGAGVAAAARETKEGKRVQHGLQRSASSAHVKRIASDNNKT